MANGCTSTFMKFFLQDGSFHSFSKLIDVLYRCRLVSGSHDDSCGAWSYFFFLDWMGEKGSIYLFMYTDGYIYSVFLMLRWGLYTVDPSCD